LKIHVYKVDFENSWVPELVLDVNPLTVDYKYFPSYNEMMSFIKIEKKKYDEKCTTEEIDLTVEQLAKKINDSLPDCYKNMIQCNPKEEDIVSRDSCNIATTNKIKKKNLWTKELLILLLKDMKKKYDCTYDNYDDTKGIDICPKDDPPPVPLPKPLPKPPPPTPFRIRPPPTTQASLVPPPPPYNKNS